MNNKSHVPNFKCLHFSVPSFGTCPFKWKKRKTKSRLLANSVKGFFLDCVCSGEHSGSIHIIAWEIAANSLVYITSVALYSHPIAGYPGQSGSVSDWLAVSGQNSDF